MLHFTLNSAKFNSGHITGAEWRDEVTSELALCLHHQAYHGSFKNIYSDWNLFWGIFIARTHTHTHTHTHGRTPLYKWSVRCIGRYLQNTQQKNIRALNEIRTYDHSKRAPSHLLFRPPGQRDRRLRDYRLWNGVDKDCDLLGHYAASSGNFLPTFRYNLSVSSSGVKNLW
jgi:hypothetical protein